MIILQQYSNVPITKIKEQLVQIAFPFIDYFLETKNGRIEPVMKENLVFPAHIWRTFVNTNVVKHDADHVTDLMNHAIHEGLYIPLSVRESSAVLGISTRWAGSYLRFRPDHLQAYARYKAGEASAADLLAPPPVAPIVPDQPNRQGVAFNPPPLAPTGTSR
ncbi:hypothetical protein [Neoaquamicrobium sediminum]|uniref:hypothetical protein n=1 Tax=Neoaquamicrobium sediminum TaxID=1849104 RepID=UPI0040357313